MMITLQQWIDANRENLGFPFQHQARCKGVAFDCIGTIVSAAKSLGQNVDGVPANYGEFPDPLILLNYLANSPLVRFDQTRTRAPGYIAVTVLDKEPQHFGVFSFDGNWIHASRHVKRVVETPFNVKEKHLHSIWIPTFVDFSS